MLGHIALSFWRDLLRHRLYAALNIAGLSLGIATFLTLGLIAAYEYDFDASIPDAQNVYRLDEIYELAGQPKFEVDGASFAITPFLRDEIPQISASGILMPENDTILHGATRSADEVDFVDASFLDVMRPRFVAGTPAQALRGTDAIVVPEAMARKYFGRTDIVGERLSVSHDGTTRDYVVTGVLAAQPANTTLEYSALALVPSAMRGTPAFQQWGMISGSVFVRTHHPMTQAALTQALRDVARRHFFEKGTDQATLLRSIHFTAVAAPAWHFYDSHIIGDDRAADPRIVACLFAVGVLALVAAAINYVNLATARALQRAREVAMRKVIGASRMALIAQFLGEAVVLTAIAGAIGLALAEMAIPVANALGGWHAAIRYSFVLPVLLAVILAVGLGAGGYPAFALAAFRPATVLASTRMPSGGRMGSRVRSLLVGSQFAFAVGLAICTLVVDAQARYLRVADRGFDRSGLIVVPSLSDQALGARQRAILDMFKSVPGVVDAGISRSVPGRAFTYDQSAWRPGATGRHPTLSMVAVGHDYFSTYRITPLAGRVFDDAHRADDYASAGRSGQAGIMIDTTAMRLFGWRTPRDALGQVVMSDGDGALVSGTIIGVVAPIRLASAHDAQGPQIFHYYRDVLPEGIATLRYTHADPQALMAQLGEKWRLLAPDIAFSAETVDENLAQYYRPDQHRGELFSLGAIIAIVIACLGLYGLAALNATRRLHEIGVRKTLGASTRQVMMLVIGQFLRPVAMACLVAWPVAFLAMHAWLAGFDQRIALSPLYFIGVTLGALVLCAATVLGQTLRLARAEPARALHAG